jgi:NADH:ubiquinone oxidoreductase subunit 5 (subunit L)/multisubunit Na+/H+ antiporter MnhA subunit
VIEKDLRRVLAYSVNNQLGFMVVGIGRGTELGINGAVAHAFADILFKAVLCMSMGAVLLRTGTVKGTDVAHDSGIRCSEAPKSMLLAMAIGASLCIGIGVFPTLLYAILPHAVDYVPHTASHVLAQLQLLVFSALAFAVLMRTGIFPSELRAINLDSDSTYRGAAVHITRRILASHTYLSAKLATLLAQMTDASVRHFARMNGAHGLLKRQWPSSSMALWVMLLLVAYLALYHTS